MKYEERPFSGVYYATTNYELHNMNYRRPISTTYKPKLATTRRIINAIIDETSGNQKENFLATVEEQERSEINANSTTSSFLDGRVNRRVDNKTNIDANSTDTTEETILQTEFNTTDLWTMLYDYNATENYSEYTTTSTTSTEYEITTMDQQEPNSSSTIDSTETAQISSSTIRLPVTLKTVTNSTDCLQEADKRIDVLDPTMMEPDGMENDDEENASTISSVLHDITEVDLEFKVNVATASSSLLPKIEPIENVTKPKEETNDYDYNDLPPSLPNLQYVLCHKGVCYLVLHNYFTG